jgi:tripartite-type tricarboxylate transporter receptor subunit TctC
VLRSIAAILIALAAATARSAEAEDFYRGKTLNLVIGYSTGGGYDLYARLLAQHLGRHIPGNPAVVPQNMPGAGSRKAGMYLYGVAPKDGTTIGTIGRNEPIAPLIEQDAKFDGTQFAWIGSIASDDSICFSWRGSRVRTWQDLQERELTVGALAPGDNTVTVPLALRNLFGAKLKLVKGYPGTNEMFLALERGEIEGACGVSWRPILSQRQDWITGRKIQVLVEVALERDPTLAGVPLITEIVDNADGLKALSILIATQAMARPFLAPPGIPETRRNVLRQAFAATMQDPRFLSDAERAGLYIHPMAGTDIDLLLKRLYATPKELIARAAKAILE